MEIGGSSKAPKGEDSGCGGVGWLGRGQAQRV